MSFIVAAAARWVGKEIVEHVEDAAINSIRNYRVNLAKAAVVKSGKVVEADMKNIAYTSRRYAATVGTIPGALNAFMSSVHVKTVGLKELRDDLRRIGKLLPAEIKAINFEVANEIIVPEARRRASGSIGRTRTGHPLRPGYAVVSNIRALRNAKGGMVAIGSAKVPWAAGMEFGSVGVKHTAKGGHTTQFAPWRGRGQEAGYFIYPTIRDKRAEVLERYAKRIGALMEAPR